MQAFPDTDDTRTVEDIDRHIKRMNMRPAAMTDEQCDAIWASVRNHRMLTNAKSPWLWQLLFDYARAVESARDEQWMAMRDERIAALEAKVAELRAVCKKAFDDLGVLVERSSSEETITITVKTADIAAARAALSDLAQAGEGE